MGVVAAVAGAVSALLGLVLYLFKRHDSPAAASKRLDDAKEDDFRKLDKALAAQDGEAVSRMFSEHDDRLGALLLRPEDGGNTGGQGDKGAP
jgi:hypothetical protein